RVFSEKPGALSAGQAQTLAETAESLRVPAAVDLVMRHNPIYRALKYLVESGAIGEVERLVVENYAHDEHLTGDHWFWKKQVSGGIWVEHGIHFFDLANWILGTTKVESVAAVSMKRHAESPGTSIEDRVAALVRYPEGVLGSFYHGFRRPERFERTTLQLVCSRAYVTVRGWVPTAMEVDALTERPLPGGPFEQAAATAVEQLAVLQPSTEPRLSLRWAVESLERYEAEASTFRGCGVTFTAHDRARAVYEMLPDRWELYYGCVRA
ncbi:MAG: Gfo/Idh/MocA family oxidoreductase, partial [Thermoleophilia bacterium]|nr:Gfo/Idh/MocA family oxidoreductase [Thermoleophilia bacterium]